MQRISFADKNCSVAQALELVGEWWTLMIVRDALLGVTRERRGRREQALLEARRELHLLLERRLAGLLFEQRIAALEGGVAAVATSSGQAAQFIANEMTKPVVSYIAGVTAPPGKRMGHAGALISGGADTADAKLAVMEECGFKVTRNPSEMGRILKSLL